MEENGILSSCALYLDFETKKSMDSRRRLNIEKIYNNKLQKKEEAYILSINDEYKGQFNKRGFSINAATSSELVSEAKRILTIFDSTLNSKTNAIVRFKFLKKCTDEDSIIQQFELIKEIIGETELLVSRVEFLGYTTKLQLSIFVEVAISEDGLKVYVSSKVDNLEKIPEIDIEIDNYVKEKILKTKKRN